MNSDKTTEVERLYPFALRTKIQVVGISPVLRLQKHLQLLFLASDLSEHSKGKMSSVLSRVPIVTHYDSAALSHLFGVSGLKVLGLKKTPLAVSILKELKGQGRVIYPNSHLVKNTQVPRIA